MPSPYSVDLFAAIEADGRITPRVLYMEMAAPDTYWGQVRLPESAEVPAGAVGGISAADGSTGIQACIRAIRDSRPDLVVVSGYNSLTCQSGPCGGCTGDELPWVFWGEIPGMRALGGLAARSEASHNGRLCVGPMRSRPSESKAVEEYRRSARPANGSR